MLTLSQAPALPLSGVASCFRCEAVAYNPLDPAGRTWQISHQIAGSAFESLRWIRMRSADVAAQSDPAAHRPVRAWLQDPAVHAQALDLIAAGSPFSCMFVDPSDGTRYVLSVQRVDPPITLGPDLPAAL